MALTLEITTTSKKAANEIKNMATKAGASVKTLEKKSVSSAKQMTTSFSKLSRVLGPIGLGAGIGGVIISIGKLTKSITGFETAMAEVSTLVDTSVTDMGKLNDAVLDLTTKVPQNAVEISKGLYQTISAGITDVNDALFVLESASRAATAGLTDTLTAVDVGTTIINAYGFSVDEINRVNDVLFNTVKEGKTRFDQLAGSIGRVAPIAAQAGLEFEELTAAAATLTKGGISTDEAMTAIRATLVQVLKPSKDAQILAAKLGIEFNATALRAKGLGGFLEDVADKTGGNIEQITTLFGNVRALAGVLALAGKQSGEFARILNTNRNSAGSAEEAFNKMNVTAESQWKIFKNQLNKQVLEFGEKILPTATGALIELNEAARDNREFIDKLQDDVKNLEGPFDSWLARLGPVKTDLDALAIPLSDLTALLDGTSKAVLDFAAGPKFGDFFTVDEATADRTDDLISKAIAAQAQIAIDAKAAIEAEKLRLLLLEQRQAQSRILLDIQRSTATLLMNNFTVDNERLNTAAKFIEQEEEITDLKKIDIKESQALLIAQLSLTRSAEQFADNFGIALVNTKSLSEALKTVLKQLSNRILAGLISGGISSLIPGGGFLSTFRKITGFQEGGSFRVPGPSTGTDSQLVAFRGSPGETVNVTPAGSSTTNNNQKVDLHFNFNVADEITIKTKVIPIINDFVQRQGGKLVASKVA